MASLPQETGPNEVLITDELLGIGAWSYHEHQSSGNKEQSDISLEDSGEDVLNSTEGRNLNSIEQGGLDLVDDQVLAGDGECQATSRSEYAGLELNEKVDQDPQPNTSAPRMSSEAKQDTTDIKLSNDDAVQRIWPSHDHPDTPVPTGPVQRRRRQSDGPWSPVQSTVGIQNMTVVQYEVQGLQTPTSLQSTNNGPRRPRSYSV